MQNLWAFDNSANDSASKCDLTIQSNVVPSVDRFGNANSAMYFSKSYATAPSGVYFNPVTGGLTMMVWIKLVSLNNYQRIIDCGNVNGVDTIIFGSSSTTSTMKTWIFPGGLATISNSSVTLNVWAHLAITSTQTTVKMYFNGILDATATGNI